MSNELAVMIAGADGLITKDILLKKYFSTFLLAEPESISVIPQNNQNKWFVQLLLENITGRNCHDLINKGATHLQIAPFDDILISVKFQVDQ